MTSDDLFRYQRQVRCSHLGEPGQKALRAGRALVVGAGGLGTWTAEILARSGIGMLRLVDDDLVELHNIHRQALYVEADDGRAKVDAAAERLAAINSSVTVETARERLTAENIARLASDVHVIIDGCDNFASRFVINDWAVRESIPWVFAGVLASEAQTATIVPGWTACLRCIYDGPPAEGKEPSNAVFGVLPAAVMTICGIQAVEVMKILTGRIDDISNRLLKFDFWTNQLQTMALPKAGQLDCPCCRNREFEFLQ